MIRSTIKENSVTLKGGKLIFEIDTHVLGVQEGQQQQPTVPVVACEIGQKDAFDINKVATRSQSREASFKSDLPINGGHLLVNTPRVQGIDFPAAESDVLANQVNQEQVESALDSQQVESPLDSPEKSTDKVGHETEVSLGQFSDTDPNFVKSALRIIFSKILKFQIG